jgi:uncharacterized protein (TIGR02145 family)
MTGGSFPTGVTGAASGSSFTISGTPSATSTRGYTLTTTVGGCASSSTAGTMTVVSSIQGVASTQTWVIGAQTWSAPLKKAQAGCTQTTDFGSITNPPMTAYYRSSELYNSSSGYLYNWNCVNDYGYLLCPSPWRVPSNTDIGALHTALGGVNSYTPVQYTMPDGWIVAKYGTAWGGVFAGVGLGADVVEKGTRLNIWGTTELDDTRALALQLRLPTTACTNCVSLKSSGYQVRCVR